MNLIKTKRYFILTISLIIIAFTGIFIANAASSSWSDEANAKIDWYDSSYTTFQIDTPEKLAGVAKLVNEGNDLRDKILEVSVDNIDLSAHDWVPIGTSANPFRGTLVAKAGNLYNISGMNINNNYEQCGFVGYMDNATIGGFVVEGNISSSSTSSSAISIGGIVGKAVGNSTIYNSTNKVAIDIVATNSDAYVGGIIGSGTGTISTSSNEGAISVSSNNSYVGGIIGAPISGTDIKIKKVDNKGEITGNAVTVSSVGGIVGYAEGTGTKVDLSEEATPIQNGGNIKATGATAYAGGILGYGDNSPIVNFSDATSNSGGVTISDTTASNAYAGGLVGYFGQSYIHNIAFENTGVITNDAKTNTYSGGIVGYVNGAFTLGKSFTNTVAITASGADGVYTGGIIGYATSDINLNADAKNEGAITVTASTSETYTGGLVGNAGSKLAFTSNSDNAYSNEGDINVIGGVGVYTGGIVSNKAYTKTINNVNSLGTITVNGNKKIYTGGFIGIVSGDDVNISNETFSKIIKVTGSENDNDNKICTGGIVGYYEKTGVISDASFLGEISTNAAYAYTGGIAGYVSGGKLSNITIGNNANIISSGNSGGIAGFIDGTVDTATVKDASIEANISNGYVGGIAGKAKGTIANVTIGDESAEDNKSVKMQAKNNNVSVGGIVGANDGALSISSSKIRKIEITSTKNTNCVLSGIIANASPQATLGNEENPLDLKDITINSNGSGALVGGVIGINQSNAINVKAENVTINSISGANSYIGGIIAKNSGDLNNSNIVLTKGITMASDGDSSIIGGMIGDNTKTLTSIKAENIAITSDGKTSKIGGIVGNNSAILSDLEIKNSSIISNGSNSNVGGISGYTSSEIKNAKVCENEIANPSITVNGDNSNVGGIVGFAENTSIVGNGTDNNIANATIITGDLSNNSKVGGIVGNNILTEVSNMLNDSSIITVNGEISTIGGVVGYSTGKIENVKTKNNVIKANAIKAKVGGIAGEIQDASIKGNATENNLENLIILVNNAATDATVGGMVGYNLKSKIENVFATTLKITANAANSKVGGMLGYNKGTDTAILVNSFINGLKIIANDTATTSTIGGIIGVNDARDGQVDSAEIKTAISSIQNTRSVGSIDSHSDNSIIGGLCGKNNTIVANNSVTDKLPLISQGDNCLIGGLIGKNTGTIYYTYSNAALTIGGSETCAGGLVGENSGKILSSYIETDIVSDSIGTENAYAYLGGLVGKNSGEIEKSYVSSKVTANGAYACVGGLVGDHTGKIVNSYSAMPIYANKPHSYVGGLLGRNTTGTVLNSYSAGQVNESNGAYAGGFIGRYDTKDKTLLNGCYYVKDEAKHVNSGLLDFADGEYYELNQYGRLSPILTSALSNRKSFPTLSGWIFDDSNWRYGSINAAYAYPELNRTANSGGNSGGSGNDVNININWYTKNKEETFFNIKTEAELAGLSALVSGNVIGSEKFNFKGKTITITEPIHIQSEQWIPIGNSEDNAFEGTLQGGNNLISGLKVSNNAYAGLFGVIGSSAKVTNIKIEPTLITGTQYVGTLAGLNKGTISNGNITLLNQAKITNGSYVGGICGKNTGNIVNTSIVIDGLSEIQSDKDNAIVGGMVGENVSKFTDMTIKMIKGSVEAKGANAVLGGIIGKQTGDVSKIATEIMGDGLVKATGINSIVGGNIGHYISGNASNLSLKLTDGKVEGNGLNSIIGGLIGKSEKENKIDTAELNAENTVDVIADNTANVINIKGNGVVAGIVGEKIGNSNDTIDIKNIKVNKAVITTTDNSIMGGVIGKATDVVLKEFMFNAPINVTGNNVKLGGVVGQAINTVIYKVDIKSNINFTTRNGSNTVGGVVGTIETNSDVNKPYNLGGLLPVYKGIFEANVNNGSIKVNGTGNSSDLAVGSISGESKGSSIYNSKATIDIDVIGVKNANIGGIVGLNSGNIVNSVAQVGISGSMCSIYNVGGIVGSSTAGNIQYSKSINNDTNGNKIVIGAAKENTGVAPATHVGGFVGSADNTTIKYSFSNMHIDVKCDNPHNTLYVGGFAGLLGENTTGLIEKSYATGKVNTLGKAGSYVGGFVGAVNKYTISETYAEGDILNSAFDSRSGGFVGLANKEAIIKKSYSTQNSVSSEGINEATRSYGGGFAGYNDGSIEEVYSRVPLVTAVAKGSNSYVGSFIGYNFRNGKVTKSYYAGNLNAINQNAAGKQEITKVDFQEKQKFSNWDFSTNNSTWSYINGVNGNGPILVNVTNWSFEPDTSIFLNEEAASTEFIIENEKQLGTVALLYNDLNYYKLFDRSAVLGKAISKITLGKNMALSSKLWTPIADFSGVFDGNSKTITGLYQYADAYDTYGFIGVNKGTIKNITFVDSDILVGTKAGIVAGVNSSEGNITNINITGNSSIYGTTDYIGGIVGENNGAIKSVNIEKIIIDGNDMIGGVAGKNNGVIDEATIKSNTISGNKTIGGISGESLGEITNSYSKGNLNVNNGSSSILAGGLTGKNAEKANIKQSFSLMEIKVISSTPNASATISTLVGGIAGENNGNIDNCYNSGNINTESSYISKTGGIVGYGNGGEISNSLNYGKVIGSSDGKIVANKTYYGGIAGQIKDNCIINNLVFDRQMLKENTAYYNENGNRVKSDSGKAIGTKTQELVGLVLLQGFDGSIWGKTQGFYPHLKNFSVLNDSKLSTVAIVLNVEDIISNVATEFELTNNTEVKWNANKDEITIINNKGSIKTTGKADLIVTVGGENRTITINEPALKYAETSANPAADPKDTTFEKEILVKLSTTEVDGKIYYTLDGKKPTEEDTLYTTDIKLLDTSTIKAISILDGKENSDILSVVYTKLKDQDAPIGLVGVSPTTTTNNDGKITGTTVEMEYKLQSATTYTVATAIEIKGLAAGTYNVRYAVKPGFNVGKVTDVVVGAYVVPIPNPGTGGSGGSGGTGGAITPMPTPIEEQITSNVTDGKNDKVISKIVIKRVTEVDGTKKDTVTYEEKQAKEAVEQLKKAGKDTARIVIQDVKDEVKETLINIPRSTLGAIGQGNINLEIDTDNVRLNIPKESIQDLNKETNKDLFFRVIPIKKEEEKIKIEQRAKIEAVVKQVVKEGNISVIGRPVTIETNMSQKAVDIVLPLKGVIIPTDAKQKEALLSKLAVFIEHSDGEKEVVKGEIVDYKKGELGIKFRITKFSTFTIIKVDTPEKPNVIETKKVPQITFVGVEHSPLSVGETQSFYITSKSDNKVQYRMFLHNDTNKTKEELTSGYTELVRPDFPYLIAPDHKFTLGKYRVEIWVKQEGSNKEYDSTYTAYLNCVNKDDKNRVYTNGDLMIEKDTYTVGEKVVISGIKDIGGITGPYYYRLHILRPDQIGKDGKNSNGWYYYVTDYKSAIEWTPQEPGTYIMDVHVITPNSILWKNKDRKNKLIYGTYEGWKLKTIIVNEKPTNNYPVNKK